MCQHLSVRESSKISLLPFPVFLFAFLCVPLIIFSDINRRNFNDPVDPGVQSTIESAQTLSPRPYAQTWSLWVWTVGTLVGSMFLSRPEEHLWRPAPSRPEPQKSQGHLVFIPSPLPSPPPNPALCVLWGRGCDPLVSACQFLGLCLDLLHLSLCQCLSENSTWS